MAAGQIAPKTSPGASHYASSKENVERVNSMVKTDPTTSFFAFATLLDLTKCSVWIIVRKIIGLYPYKSQTI